MLISNPMKKFKKTYAKKLSAKKGQKNRVFYFYYFVQTFSAQNFFGVVFSPFFNGFELGIKVCVLWYPYRIFYDFFRCLNYHFLLTLMPIFDETAQKNEKKYFINVP
jgi:hypothetical protein